MFSNLGRQARLGAIVAVVSLVAACGGGSNKSTSTSRSAASTRVKSKPTQCGSSGCSVVRTTRSLPPVTVFYGASCSGTHGPWFLNVVEGGGTAALRPSYSLRWSFVGDSRSASPTASYIRVPPTHSTTATLTLRNGALNLKGARKPKAPVIGTGTLTVKLTGTSSSPTLTFIETGLSRTEQRLGLRSPFDVGGKPLVVPVQRVSSLAGC